MPKISAKTKKMMKKAHENRGRSPKLTAKSINKAGKSVSGGSKTGGQLKRVVDRSIRKKTNDGF